MHLLAALKSVVVCQGVISTQLVRSRNYGKIRNGEIQQQWEVSRSKEKRQSRDVYQAKYEVKTKRFGNIVCCVRMIRNVMCLMCLRFQRGRSVDQDIIGEQCIRNDHGVLVAHLIDKDMVREPSSKMKNERMLDNQVQCQKW